MAASLDQQLVRLLQCHILPVYFEDAEKEIDQIVMLAGGREKRRFTAKEWDNIKAFFEDFVR